MNEYISREEAISHPFANGRYDKEHANEHFILGHESYKEWLEHIPSADVISVEWIEKYIKDSLYDTTELEDMLQRWRKENE